MTTEKTIDDAINQFARDAGRNEIITGWIVLAATSTIDADGQDVSGIELIYNNGNMPWTHALGLVEAARLRMHAGFGG
jgi:hypothetical protein